MILPARPDATRDPGLARFESSASPLWLRDRRAARERAGRLPRRHAAPHRRPIPDEAHGFEFSRAHLADVRTAFARMIRRGEEKLHRVCELLCETYLRFAVHAAERRHRRGRDDDGALHAGAAVSCRPICTRRPTSISAPGSCGGCATTTAADGAAPCSWRTSSSTSRTRPNAWGIHKFISRIKAEEQIWNKVVDTIFGLDRLVRADKQLRHLGRFVKDVFGVKAIVGDPDEARALHEALQRSHWSSSILETHGVPMLATHRRASSSSRSRTTWRSGGARRPGGRRSSRCSAGGTAMIEVQVQPLANYHREREALTRRKPRRLQGAPRGAAQPDRRPTAAVRLLPRPAPLAVSLAGRTGADVRLGPHHPDRLRRDPCPPIPTGSARTTTTRPRPSRRRKRPSVRVRRPSRRRARSRPGWVHPHICVCLPRASNIFVQARFSMPM